MSDDFKRICKIRFSQVLDIKQKLARRRIARLCLAGLLM